MEKEIDNVQSGQKAVRQMNVSLIAHDKKKTDMIELAKRSKDILSKHNLFATGTTGKLIMEATGLSVTRFMSGPFGGDQQIGALIASHKMDLVIFLRDPLTSQPHEPDVTALLRLCDVHNVPLATNLVGAGIMLKALEEERLK